MSEQYACFVCRRLFPVDAVYEEKGSTICKGCFAARAVAVPPQIVRRYPCSSCGGMFVPDFLHDLNGRYTCHSCFSRASAGAFGDGDLAAAVVATSTSRRRKQQSTSTLIPVLIVTCVLGAIGVGVYYFQSQRQPSAGENRVAAGTDAQNPKPIHSPNPIVAGDVDTPDNQEEKDRQRKRDEQKVEDQRLAEQRQSEENARKIAQQTAAAEQQKAEQVAREQNAAAEAEQQQLQNAILEPVNDAFKFGSLTQSMCTPEFAKTIDRKLDVLDQVQFPCNISEFNIRSVSVGRDGKATVQIFAKYARHDGTPLQRAFFVTEVNMNGKWLVDFSSFFDHY
jgi:hypothetical protein